MSIFSSYKKIFLLGFIIVILIAIPFSVYIAQQRQQTQTQAAKSTTLSFEPASTTVNVGDTLTLSIMLDPGTGTTANQVSFAKLSINFDPTKFTTITKTSDTDQSLVKNTDSANTLQTPVEEAKYDNAAGKATLSLSIGADPTKAVVTKTKIAILKLKAIAATTSSTPTSISFDTTDITNDAGTKIPNTQVLSIASADQTSENVLNILSSAAPATVIVSSAIPTATPTLALALTSTPTPTGTSSASTAPTCVSLNADRSLTGAAPYALTFTAVGNDSDGTVNKVSFNFGDGFAQDITTGGGIGTGFLNLPISHTYNNAGTYTALVTLTDNKNNLSAQQINCTKIITVSGSGTLSSTQATIQPPPAQVTLPPTGPGEKILGIGAIGVIFTIIGTALLLSL
jgi:hypothetical protein